MLKIGDPIYWLSEDQKEIIEEKVEEIGINEDGSVFITGDPDYTLGDASWAFLTKEDAERYQQDPDSFPKDYGHVDIEEYNLPYKPGIYYYVEYDGLEHRWWEIFVEHYTYIKIKGKQLYIGDGNTECIAGDDTFFRTLREAEEYIESQGGRLGRIYDLQE